MKNILMSVVVITTLVAAGVGGTFAGFVDTEISEDNFVQAGISDLLVNGLNDPDVPAKLTFTHATPSKSTDFQIDLYNWGVCQGGLIYMKFMNIDSYEAGTKLHEGVRYVYDGVSAGDPDTLNPPPGYRAAVDDEPAGPNVWSSEPEKIAEVGGGLVADIFVGPDHPCLMGEDYASGVSEHLDVRVQVPHIGATGNTLGNPDTDGSGRISASEYEAWEVAGNRWTTIRFVPTGVEQKLFRLEGVKKELGFLVTQTKTFILVDVVIQQLECPDWPDPQTKWWPTNALQGDIAEWDMLFELNTDP